MCFIDTNRLRVNFKTGLIYLNLVFHLLNFDRYAKSDKSKELINSQMQFIQLEYERIRVLSNNNTQKVLIFIDGGKPDHSMFISYKQKNFHQTLISVDPYLHFDLRYYTLRNFLSENDLDALQKYIDEYLLSNLKSTKLPEEKENVVNLN